MTSFSFNVIKSSLVKENENDKRNKLTSVNNVIYKEVYEAIAKVPFWPFILLTINIVQERL